MLDELFGALPAQRRVGVAVLAVDARRAHLGHVAAHVLERRLDHEPLHAVPVAGADTLPVRGAVGGVHCAVVLRCSSQFNQCNGSRAAAYGRGRIGEQKKYIRRLGETAVAHSGYRRTVFSYPNASCSAAIPAGRRTASAGRMASKKALSYSRTRTTTGMGTAWPRISACFFVSRLASTVRNCSAPATPAKTARMSFSSVNSAVSRVPSCEATSGSIPDGRWSTTSRVTLYLRISRAMVPKLVFRAACGFRNLCASSMHSTRRRGWSAARLDIMS